MTNYRILAITSGYNFRDIGGYQTKDGKTVKWRKVIRSGDLSTLSDQDLGYLKKYNITCDVDLRSNAEQTKAPDRVPDDAKQISNPVFNTGHDKSDEDYARQYSSDPNSGRNNMLSSYKYMILSRDARKAFTKLFELLLKNDQDQNVLIYHCAQGKDRTGVATFLFLYALGVDIDTIKQDYLISKKQMKPYIQKQIDFYSKFGMNDILRHNLENLYTVSLDYIDMAINTMTENYGSIDNFIHQGLGISLEQIKRLREIYLTD
ncbi:tyrosine-protein phosphatase [Apilactobacillus sp. TMW 2.2459]|uniref:tyrosine-protein phosphatase n=1 Tax=Apilactobacillus xinyiensis TaxID=2841032 RepID=UPI00200BB9D2|nr:tyrosine-protein phosphatase [Apilactobacillus xinyiensis]MCL0312640.1 tyrosine-protein phosphatase [Apilactobacillus xinyiensis]